MKGAVYSENVATILKIAAISNGARVSYSRARVRARVRLR